MALPFMTVFTRCFRRPKGLERNMDSLAMQTDQDYEHILIHDPNPDGSGMLWANSQFDAHKHLVKGAYVFLLDDDDHITNAKFVERLKIIAYNEGWPDVIMFRWDHLGHGMMPAQEHWGKQPAIGAIGGSCFVVRRAMWLDHIHHFNRNACGDFSMIEHIWLTNPKVYWQDEVMGEVGYTGGSRGEPEK